MIMHILLLSLFLHLLLSCPTKSLQYIGKHIVTIIENYKISPINDRHVHAIFPKLD